MITLTSDHCEQLFNEAAQVYKKIIAYEKVYNTLPDGEYFATQIHCNKLHEIQTKFLQHNTTAFGSMYKAGALTACIGGLSILENKYSIKPKEIICHNKNGNRLLAG